MAGLMTSIENSIATNMTDMVNHADSVVHNDIYATNVEYYEGFQWIAALDSYTCQICASLDNNIYTSLADGTRAKHADAMLDRMDNQFVDAAAAKEEPAEIRIRNELDERFDADGWDMVKTMKGEEGEPILQYNNPNFTQTSEENKLYYHATGVKQLQSIMDKGLSTDFARGFNGRSIWANQSFRKNSITDDMDAVVIFSEHPNNGYRSAQGVEFGDIDPKQIVGIRLRKK